MTTIDELKAYVDSQDTDLQAIWQQDFEDFTHEVTHILENYDTYITGRVDSIHEQVWEGVESTLSLDSTAPVQNKVITAALANKSEIDHNHDERYYTESEVDTFLANKVNIDGNKGLSTNDYTDADKEAVAQISAISQAVAAGAVAGVKGSAEISYRTGLVSLTPSHLGLGDVNNTSDLNKPISNATQTALNNKVDKIAGKGLSTNDFTDAYKEELDTLNETYSITLDGSLDIASSHPVRNSAITAAINQKAPINSPAFTGTPTAPNLTTNSSGSQIVNKNSLDSYIQNLHINDVYFITRETTYNDLLTILTNGNDKQVPIFLATTEITGTVGTMALYYTERTNTAIYFTSYIPTSNSYFIYIIDNTNQITTNTIAVAPLNNANLTGNPTATTQIANDNSNKIATTAYVDRAAANAGGPVIFYYGTGTLTNLYTNYTAHRLILGSMDNTLYTLASVEYNINMTAITKATFSNVANNQCSGFICEQGQNQLEWSTFNYNITPTTNAIFTNNPRINAYQAPTNNLEYVTKQYVDNLSSVQNYNTIGQSSGQAGTYATSDGYNTNAPATAAHAEGFETSALGENSHTDGLGTITSSPYSHAGGCYNQDLTTFDTVTTTDPETGDEITEQVLDQQYLEFIGNGTELSRSNARTLDFQGNETLAGKLTVGTAPTNNMDVTTKQYVDTAVTAIDYNENNSTAIGYIKNRPFYSEYNTVTTNIQQGASIPPAGFVTDSANGVCYNWSGTPAQSTIRALNYSFGANDYINVRFNNVAYVLVQGRMQNGYAIWSVERITTALPGDSSICSSTNPIAFYIPTNSTSLPIKICIHNSLYQNSNISFSIVSLVVLTETVHTIDDKYLTGVTLQGAMAANVVNITDSSLKIANTAFVQQAIEANADFGHSSNSTGIYHPASISPQSVGNGSLLLTEACGTTLGTKSLSISTGYGISLKSEAAAGATQYAVQNNYVNRIICSGLVSGVIAQSEETANVTVKVLSVQINGADFTPNSNWSSDDIIITTETSLNPTEAITQIRAYPAQQGFSNLYIGQQVANLSSSNGASLIGGQKVTNKSGNANALIGQEIFNAGNGSAIFGRRHINRKNRVFLAGTGHDTTNATENVAALGAYSLLDSTTSFAVGNGTDEEHRSNIFKVDTSGNTTIAGTLTTSSSGITIGSTAITETQLQQLLALLT